VWLICTSISEDPVSPFSEHVNDTGDGDRFFCNVNIYLGDCMSSLFIR